MPRCFGCEKYYLGSPQAHVCPDGTTYDMRVLRAREQDERKNGYVYMPLTEEDKKLLKGMKIKSD